MRVLPQGFCVLPREPTTLWCPSHHDTDPTGQQPYITLTLHEAAAIAKCLHELLPVGWMPLGISNHSCHVWLLETYLLLCKITAPLSKAGKHWRCDSGRESVGLGV